MKQKFLWYSDTHFNFTFPWTQYNFVSHILEENPKGLIISGDIACGITIKHILTFLAKKLENIPIYFVKGNHDSYSISFKESYNKTIDVCKQYSNLFWMNEYDNIPLNNESAIIGDDGWYDGRLNEFQYLAWNLDWIMIEEFSKLKSFEEKLSLTRQLADISAFKLQKKLETALQKYKTIYILTHVPPWAEATRSVGKETEKFWLPYNVNYHLGKMIEEVAAAHPYQNIIVLSGHTHQPTFVNVSHNIECLVQSGKYLGTPIEHNCLFI